MITASLTSHTLSGLFRGRRCAPDLHLVAAHENGFVMHVDAGAFVIWDYGHYISDAQFAFRLGYIHRSVLFAKVEKLRAWLLHYVSVTSLRP